MGETSFEPLKDEYDETKTFKNICWTKGKCCEHDRDQFL
jgi:hypothetical protein